MFDQTPMNRLNGIGWRHQPDSDQKQDKFETGGVRHLLSDITELVELQCRLMADDVRNSLTSLVKPSLLVLCSTIIFLGTLPVVLLAGADALVTELQWTQYAAQFACAGIAVLIATGLTVLAIQKFKKSGMPLQQSMTELEKNLHTLREMLVQKDMRTAKSSPRENSN